MADKTEKTVAVRLQLTITDAQGVMFDCSNEWNNIPLLAAVYIEQKLIYVLTEMHGWGKALAQGDVPDIQM